MHYERQPLKDTLQELAEISLMRMFFKIGLYLQIGLIFVQIIRKGGKQVLCAELGGRIVLVGWTEKCCPTFQFEASFFSLHHADSITVVIFKVIEMDASHGILDI